jgi:hypothetical protein
VQQTKSGEFEIGSALERHPYTITVAMSLEFEKQIHRSQRSGMERKAVIYIFHSQWIEANPLIL